MGTKNNPGKYDCYGKAQPDEPLFTLRGKDVSAPYFVRMWAAVRQGHFLEAHQIFEEMRTDPRIVALIGQCEKFDECESVAADMKDWRFRLDLLDEGTGSPERVKLTVERPAISVRTPAREGQ